MPTKTSNGTGGGDWGTAGTWAGGVVPVDDDTVVIAAGDTVIFNVDTSGFANGINGMTITGTLKVSTSTSSYMKMKAATLIVGAGTFNIGEAGAGAIPFDVKFTLTGGAGWYIDGNAGLTMTVYGAEPAIKTIKLSGAEAIGQTELSVDTNVTGDIWADGDIIKIDDIAQGRESEERIIAAGGIAAGAITVTSGLTAAKLVGAVVSLVTRNVRIIAVGTGTRTIYRVGSTANKLTIGGGLFYGCDKWFFQDCNYAVISGGAFVNANYCLYNCTYLTISGGVFSNHFSGVTNSCNISSVSGGSFSGCGSGIAGCTDVIVSGGVFSGNTRHIYTLTRSIITGGTYIGAFVGIADSTINISGGIFTANTYHFSNCTGEYSGVTLSGAITGDFDKCYGNMYDIEYTGASEFTNNLSLSRYYNAQSNNHDGVSSAFKAWCLGGIISSQSVVVPTGYTQSNKHALSSAIYPCYWNKSIVVSPGASVNISMNLRKDASMAYLPRVIVFNKANADPFAGGTGLHTFTMTDSVDIWESDIYTYTNSGSEDVTLVIRCQGMNATGNMYSELRIEQINVDLTSTIAKIDVVDALVDAIKAKTDQLAFTVANQVDANALTGGGGATAEDVRLEMDAHSTQLAAILEDTGTIIPAALGSITGAALSAAGVDAILDEVIVGSYTLRQLVKVMASKMAGKATGGGTTSITYRGVDDMSNVIVETVDTNGNRSDVTLTV